jgi:hypothetical protein
LCQKDRFNTESFKHLPAPSVWSDFDGCHVKNCILLQPALSVRVNMVEPNSGHDSFAPEPVVSPALTHAQPEPKRHNAKLCSLVLRERIVNALAAGDSKRAIARALRVSNNTVTAVAEQEWQQVEQRKARIAAQAERAATRAFDRINNKLDSPDDIPLNVLVPVAGVSVDKLVILRGDPNVVARIEHVSGGNIFEAFRRFHEDVLRKIEARELDKAHEPATGRLALTNGEAGSGSGAETRS